jgi:hypothetical protein
MDRDKYVMRYGGKAGLHKYLRDLGKFDSHLLPTAYVLPGQSPQRIFNSMNWTFDKEYIVRGSNFCDLEGLVDVLQTKGEISSMDKLCYKAREIRDNARRSDIIKYAISENPKYDKKITLMIQPELSIIEKLDYYSSETIRGSVIEHPNQRGKYYLSFVDKTVSVDKHYSLICSEEDLEEDEKLRKSGGYRPDSEYLRLGKKVVDLYKQVSRELEYINVSLQMEFGVNYLFSHLNEIILHQIRFFKEFKPQKFKLPENNFAYLVFGQTDKKGLLLDVVRTNSIRDVPKNPNPFLWIPNEIMQTDELSLSPIPNNMKVFATEENGFHNVNSLEHNLYRYVQKTEVSILSLSKKEKLEDGEKIRLFANGIDFKIDRNVC